MLPRQEIESPPSVSGRLGKENAFSKDDTNIIDLRAEMLMFEPCCHD